MTENSGIAPQPAVPPRVSVVIRCYNEEKYIGCLLEGIFRQTLSDFEVIVVDSGSTDATLDIVRRYPVKHLAIPRDEFSFGRSLNLGCSAAAGGIVVAVSAHCYPVYPDWLERLLEPFEDPKVVLAYGKQRGSQQNRFSEHQLFQQWYGEDSNYAQRHPFANNANSAFRRTAWCSQPFDETLTGLEDLDWTHKLMRTGNRIAYVAEAEIIHVHEETWGQIYNRYRREAIAMRQILPHERFTLFDLARLASAGILQDVRAAHAKQEVRQRIAEIILFRCCQYAGTYHGYHQRDPITRDLRTTFYFPMHNGMKNRPGGQNGPAPGAIDYDETGRDGGRTLFSGRKIHDISIAVERAPVWPGDTPPEIVAAKSIDTHGVAVTNLSMCVHTGTHIDAPGHFIPGGAAVSQIPLERLLGRVQVIDVGDAHEIGPSELSAAKLPPDCRRLLLRSRNSHSLRSSRFDREYVALTPEGAEWLLKRDVTLVGIDYSSIEGFGEQDNRTHHILLGAGVVVLEGLDLLNIRPGPYELICLPLKIGHIEAAPARAILIETVTGTG